MGLDVYSRLSNPGKLLAAMPGTCEWVKTPVNCVYLVFQDKSQAKYELNSIKRAIKMCERALNSKNPGGHFLVWSA